MAEPDRQPALKRGLGAWQATALGVGGTIGASIFLIPSAVAREVGSPGLELVTWLLTGFLALCGALSFAELAGAIPETGGTYQFLKRAYPNTPIAFLFGWMMFFSYAGGATAVVAAMASQYAVQFFPMLAEGGQARLRLLSVAIIVTLTVVNYRGVTEGGRAQLVLTVLKLGGIFALIVVCFALGDGSGSHFTPFLPVDRSMGSMASSIGTAMILTIFSYSGWYFVTHVAGEVKDPARNLPLAIFAGVGTVIAVYLAINAAYLYVLPFDQVQASDRVAAAAAERVLGPVGANLIAAVVIVSALGTVNAQTLNYPRIAFSLARDGLFFARLGQVHPTRRSPGAAIAVFGLVASIFALSGSYQEILTAIAFAAQSFMFLTILGLIVLRRREPDLPRPFKVPGYPIVPLLYLTIVAWYLINLLINRLGPSLIGIAITLTGLPFYWYWTRAAGPASSGRLELSE
jgi:APA family basic amino acid/polyamine antiporter